MVYNGKKTAQAKEVSSKVTDNYLNHILEQLRKLSHTPPLMESNTIQPKYFTLTLPLTEKTVKT